MTRIHRLVSAITTQPMCRSLLLAPVRSKLRWTAIALSAALVSVAGATELKILDDVVVKFGPDAELVARDKIAIGARTVFTSAKDDSVSGRLGPNAQTPAAGNWRGMRIEKSATSVQIGDGAMLRYAGGLDGAGLTLRGLSPTLNYLQLNNNLVGLRLLDAASPSIAGPSVLGNGTGFELDGASAPVITAGQFVGNTNFAINNKTPSTVVVAQGNWWGNLSGPKTAANPQGTGDQLSSGVNFGSFSSAEPLINPVVRAVSPAAFYENASVQLELSCVNATEYRIAEGGAFGGVNFTALPGGAGQVTFTASSGDGRKVVDVQYRNASQQVVSTKLAGDLLIDSQAPVVTITHPAAGSTVTQSTTLQANATDAAGIAQVRFFIDNTLVATRTSAPYTHSWVVTDVADGAHTIKAIATDNAGRTSETVSAITLAKTAVVPDTTGPELTNIASSGVALANGATFARNTTFTLAGTDKSGIARIELLLDGAVVANAGASGGSTYSVLFNLATVANGAHTLALRALDSLGNTTTVTYTITVAHAAPEAPVFTAPASGGTTRNAQITVSGNAAAGSSVQLMRNGVAAGDPVVAGSGGTFSATVTLVSGANEIRAIATDQYGASALSAALLATLDTNVPVSPGNLTATAQEGGKVRLAWARSTDPNVVGYHVYRAAVPFTAIAEASKVNGAMLSAISLDDLPPQDGTWHYRVVSVNSAATPSAPGNAAQATSDGTAPKVLSITYVALGKTDPATGRIGQGRVNVTMTVSEPLTAAFLSVVPQGGVPIAVELAKTGETTYTGGFLIDANTGSGTANVLFSGRDTISNRGTDILVGATIKIDTDGPNLSNIVLNPVSPIKNDTQAPFVATFTFSEAPVGLPQVKYLLSGPVRSAIVVSGLNQVNATTFNASITLPADAGMAAPEALSFSFTAKDELDNFSTKVSAFNRFQVYQGNLPPLNVPFGFTAVAQAGGKVKLSWQAVDDATAYQLYRQGPSQQALVALTRASGVEHIDTPGDGKYKYAVATVRQSNGQESVSGQSAAIEVTAIANAPGAPQNLALQMTGQGTYATWQPPLASVVDYYNLYRASGTSIGSIAGLTPIKSRIKNPVTYDTSPSPTQGAYVVTAVDAAGNESATSNSAYLNASLLPVRKLKVEQLGNALPQISWTAPNGNVAGYLVYVGPDAAKIKLTASQISATSLTDTGYTSGERRYTVATVDANRVELGRVIVLPNVSSSIVTGLPILRGMMNKLQVQVSNTSSETLAQVRAMVRLPINADSTVFKDHPSEMFALAPNQTRLVTVVVGGYADLAAAPVAQVGVEIIPDEDGLVKISRAQTVQVSEGSLVVGMTTEEFTRGGTGKLKLSIENTGDVDVELLTATNNGANDSSELRLKIIDGDGNVLATEPYKQVFGANVVTLTNGMTVARIPAGASYVSDTFEMNVPASSPNSIRVKLEVDKLRYHTGQPDEVQIAGRGSERTVSLLDTAYVGEVTNVSPISSFGDQDIVISGRAFDRAAKQAMPNTRLKLVLNQQGFERSFTVLTDGAGNFAYTFKPTLTDAGLYKVSAVHPSITDRPEQKAFTINRVTVGPTPYKLDVPKNVAFAIPFTAKAGVGTSATNLRLTIDAASQLTGRIPEGISVTPAAPVTLTERQTLNVPLQFLASNAAQPSGSLILNVISDEHAATPIGQVTVNYQLSEAKPFLVSTPSYLETGMAQGGNQVETLTLKNNGLQEAENLRFTLTKADGSAAPVWANIASQSNGSLAVGASRAIDLSFVPPAATQAGAYEFKLHFVGDNVAEQSVNVYVNLSQSGQGNVLFRASDIYTATPDKNGNLIAGLAGARISMQNEDVPAIAQEITTDNIGEAMFTALPAGSYKFRARATNHQEIAGRLLVKPGITATQPVFLDYNLVTVEWSVREITIQDRYDITLNMTYETDVPAAVVVMQPAGINLPKMNSGDVYYGEITLTNFGLVRADNVKQQLPTSDPFFRYEFLAEVPTTLAPKQHVTIPFRVVALSSLDGAGSGAASGAGCYNYSNVTSVTCDFKCANGATTTCSARTPFFAVSSSTCTGGGIGGGGGGGGWGGWGGGGGGGAARPQTIPKKGKKCVLVPEGGKGAPPTCGG